MTAANGNPQQVLAEEILADARRQGDRILHRAKTEAEAMIAKARADSDKAYQDVLARARGEAQSRHELVLAALPVEVGRMRYGRIETALQGIHDEARDRILKRDGFDYARSLVALAAEAIAGMAGDTFILDLSDADLKAYGATLAADVTRKVGREGLKVTVAAKPVKIQGGVVIRDADGRQIWDNSLEGRLARLWPILRSKIGAKTLQAAAEAPWKE